MADLPRQHDATCDGVDLVPLSLGLLKLLDEFADCVERTPALAVDDTPGGAADETLIAAGLGLLSLRQTLRRWFSHAVTDRSETPDRVVRSLGSILR